MANPDTQPTDDALYFANSANINLFDTSEDPDDGPSRRAALPDFNHQVSRSHVQHAVKRRPTSLQPVPAKGRQL